MLQRKIILSLMMVVVLISAPLVGQTLHRTTTDWCKEDTIIATLLPFADAGAAGKDILWDYSSLSIGDGEDYVIKQSMLPQTDSIALLRTTEHHTNYTWAVRNDSLLCVGYSNATANVMYTHPQLCQVSTMYFGDTIYSSFAGEGEYCHNLSIQTQGTTKVVLDAMGSIVLPNETVHNVCRLHTIHRYIEVFSDTTNIATDIWQWYKKGLSHPIFESIRTTHDTDSAVFSMSLLFPYAEAYETNVRYKHSSISSNDNDDFDIISDVFTEATYMPNPVTTDLFVNYQLTRSAKVGYILCSQTGVIVYQQDSMMQPSGYHQKQIPVSGLQIGTYSLYVLVDDISIKQVIIKE